MAHSINEKLQLEAAVLHIPVSKQLFGLLLINSAAISGRNPSARFIGSSILPRATRAIGRPWQTTWRCVYNYGIAI